MLKGHGAVATNQAPTCRADGPSVSKQVARWRRLRGAHSPHIGLAKSMQHTAIIFYRLFFHALRGWLPGVSALRAARSVLLRSCRVWVGGVSRGAGCVIISVESAAANRQSQKGIQLPQRMQEEDCTHRCQDFVVRRRPSQRLRAGSSAEEQG